MIKVRVDWHHKCMACGTSVVIDFVMNSSDVVVCPWCGCATILDQTLSDEDLRLYLLKTAREMEERANAKLPNIRSIAKDC